MPDHRPGEGSEPIRPSYPTNTGSAPTIDPAVPQTEPTGTQLPEHIGRFVIRGFLGAGAFGTVYRAYDPQLDREIALKVARSAGQSPERMQRFRREARAAAGLRHPHIVPLFEAGEADGHLFLASAFVPGMTLEETIDKQGGTRLPAEQTAVIVRKLADALAYAHSQGVLHRDVKSANILLDPTGEPHLLDFGLARRTDEQVRMTVDGSVLGTAAYLAPEAAKGDQSRWTPAADQYALGVVLYELLTGHTPFTGPVELVLALHQTQEPERPSRRNREVPRDLDAICLKCLEKDPAHRYATAGDLVADLDRFLRGEPVLARRQTVRYLAGKFIRRYRRPLAVTAAVLAVLVAGTAAAFVQINAERDLAVEALERAEQSSREAEESSQRAAASARQAEAGFQEARLAVDDFLTELSQEGLKNVPGLQLARLKFAQRAAERYDRYAALRPGDSSVLAGHARSLTALGSMKGQIGSLEEARAALARAITIGERLVRDNPGRPDFRVHLARSRCELGSMYTFLDKDEDARPHILESIKILESIPGTKSTTTARILLATAYNALGNSLPDHDLGKRRAYERARAIAQQLRDQHPDDPECLLCLSPPIGNLARITRVAGDHTEALRLEETFLAITDQALRLLPNAPGLTINRAIGLDSKGDTLARMGRTEEAIACYRDSAAICRRLVADNPLVNRYQEMLAYSLKNLAYVLGSRSAQSKSLLDEARRILESLVAKAEDRVYYGAALVDSWIRIAQYYEYGPGDKADPVERARARLQALGQAVREGRRLATKNPRDREAAFKCAEALFNRGMFDIKPARHRDGYPFLVEAIETFHARLAGSGRSPNADQAKGLLEWCDKALESAELLKLPDDQTRFAAVAAEFTTAATSADALENLTRVLNRAGKVHEKAGRYKEAIKCYTQGVTAGRPVLDRHPWHFYLRNGVTTGYKNLALACQHEKDVRSELLAWREYMKTWLGPYEGMKIDEYVRPGAPMTPEEAVRVRAFVAKAPGSKRFTVPCDFNGTKYPFHIYVTNYVEPHDIIADQTRWLRDVRGGTMPTEVIDSFKRLYKIAKENNVSFIDLCVYALGTADKKGGTPAAPVATAQPGTNATPEPTQELPRLVRDVADLKSRSEGGPYNPVLVSELILGYRKLGEAYQKKGTNADAIASFAEAVRLIETRPVSDQVASRRLQAELYLVLGKAHDAAKEHERAELALRRHISLLEEIGGPSPSVAHRAQADQGLAALAGVIRRRGQFAEAARVCAQAVARGSRPVADALVEIYQANTAVSGVLSGDLRETFEKAVARAKRDKKPAGEYVVMDVLLATAARHRAVAHRHLSGGRRAEYRAALADEYEVRGALVASKVIPAADRQKVAAELAVSYLEDRETNSAVLWADRSGSAVTPEFILKLGEYLQKGINTKPDPKKAEQYYYFAYYRRGKELLRSRRHKEALVDLTKLCQMRQADGEDFNLLGECQGKLGQWEEAVKAYRRSYQLNPSATGNVLELLEALVVSGRPKEVCAFAAGLDRKTWSPPPPHTRPVARNLAFANGLLAVAEQLTSDGDDETPAERRLLEITSVPGVDLSGWSWAEIDGWFAKADLPNRKKSAIARILDELKGRSPPRTTPYYPLAVGATWVYSQRRAGDPIPTLPDVVVRVVAKERMNGVECYKLERSSGKEVPTTEHLAVRYNGIYRVATGGKPLYTPYRMFALPPSVGQVWQAGGNKLGLLRSDTIEVPAGKFEAAWIVQEDRTTRKGPVAPKVWYADKVGPVKIETTGDGSDKRMRVLMLRSYSVVEVLPPPRQESE
jgi:tetratricopeptide (TPR) repeat protein/tRNA A-37 threonylcarbamoyl transferase component Bud32